MNEKLEGWEKGENKYDIENINLDLIIVLAGGLNENGMLHEWVIRRLNRAHELYILYKVPILCCGGGTYHKSPFINEKGFVIHESTECVNYLVQLGVDKDMIYREWSSYDTIANAFFSLTTHIWCNSKYKNIGIITSDFHMQRTQYIFNWIYNLNGNKYNLNYFSVSDYGLNEKMLECRNERENNSKQNIIKLREKIKNIDEFYLWLYREHNAYNNNFIISNNICEECKESY